MFCSWKCGCFADLAVGLTASQGGFYQSFYHFEGFKEENAPQEGHLVIAQSLHLISWIFSEGLETEQTPFLNKLPPPEALSR